MTRMIAFLLAVLPSAPAAFCQGLVCEPQGNVAIYSNYDGGALIINVDQNIPDLRIGVVSYEFSRITITGAYAGNVTAVWYVGFDADNDHCSLGGTTLSTTITGVPATVDSIILYPPATWPNANGNANIICNYSCDVSTSQGGCNTADQIAQWFLTHWQGTLLFHFTQYGCWGNGYSISGGGNCCANPLATEVGESDPQSVLSVSANVVGERLDVMGRGPFAIMDASGRLVCRVPASITSGSSIDLSGLTEGAYVLRSPSSGVRFVIVR